MARTKRTNAPEAIPVGEITIINESCQLYIGNVMEQRRSSTIKDEDDSEDEELAAAEAGGLERQSNTHYGDRFSILPQQRSTIQLNTYNEDPVLSYSICARMHGILFVTSKKEDDNDATTTSMDTSTTAPVQCVYNQDEGLRAPVVVPGGTYRVLDDANNPLLTEEQYDTITLALLRATQTSNRYEHLWETVMKQNLSPEIVLKRSCEEIQEAYDLSEHRRRIRLPNWYKLYPLLSIDVATSNDTRDWLNQHVYDRALSFDNGTARIDMYWRALDRQPGGNTDQHIVCYTIDCRTKTVSTRAAGNWDGTLGRREYTPQHLSTKIRTGAMSYTHLLQSLQTLGMGSSECTITDARTMDADEYDTEWTSHEILVSLPKPWTTESHATYPESFRTVAKLFLLIIKFRYDSKLPNGIVPIILEYAAPYDYIVVTKLHQRCVCGDQYRMSVREAYNQAQPTTSIPATPSQQRVVDAAAELVGMGRVNTWSDAGDGAPPCPAQEDPQVDVVSDDSSSMQVNCTIHPYYFAFPARNTITNKDSIIGTSREWECCQGKDTSGRILS